MNLHLESTHPERTIIDAIAAFDRFIEDADSFDPLGWHRVQINRDSQ